MKYNEFTELCKSKNIRISSVCDYVEMSRPGLQKALDNETIELRKLKLLCDFVRISPAQFFESGSFGIMQNKPIQKTEDLEREIELLRSQIQDKNEIIALYREKNSPVYGIVAEPEPTKLTTKK